MLLRPLQITLNLLRIRESLGHSRSALRKPCLGLCAELLDFALLVVEFSRTAGMSVSVSYATTSQMQPES